MANCIPLKYLSKIPAMYLKTTITFKYIEGLNIPQLKVEEQESLEKDLTFEELKDALTSFADNKSPGEDGFTKRIL